MSQWPDIVLHAGWLSQTQADACLSALRKEMDWKQQSIRIKGQSIDLPRLTAWHGTRAYRYSGIVNTPSPWTPTLDMLRLRLEQELGHTFNSALGNLYRTGKDSVGWHADDEPELGPQPVIASLSLGARRKFSFKPRLGGERVDYWLDHGDLLVMRGNTQRDWLHQVPKTQQPVGERLNLTFRKVW